MIHTTGEGFDNTFHFELEQEGSELSDGDAGLDTEDIELQVVGLLKQTDDCLFFWCQVRKEISFDSIGRASSCQPIAFTKSSAQVMRAAPLSRMRLLQPLENSANT